MNETAVAERPSPSATQIVARALPRTRDSWLVLGLGVLVAACWAFTRLRLYDTKSDTAYWLGVAGGVGMLLLLSYPLRKHVRFMHRWGAAKGWFAAHMILGVSGPVLILLHSNFELGSVNAAVAFFSMVIVALSGVAGRFLYLRLHRNLNGEKLTLGQMRASLDQENGSSARLRFAPRAVERCREFERLAVERRIVTGVEVLRAMALLPWQRWRAARWCRAELRRKLVAVAHAEGWTRRKLNARVHLAGQIVDEYLLAAHRVAMFAAWERLFSWWHVAHVPFVYLLVVSAVVHVVAVHAY